MVRHIHVPIYNNNNISPPKTPAWKLRLEKKIGALRSDLTRLLNWHRMIRQRINHQIKPLLQKYNLKPDRETFENDFITVTEKLKQTISAKGKRLSRYNKSLKRKQDNQLFHKNQVLLSQP